MSTLLILQGVPGSGKTTEALKLVSEGWARVNRDDIRFTLFGSYWGEKVNEYVVTRVEDTAVYQLLVAGRNTVLDATNLNKSNLRRRFANLPPGTDIEFKRLEVPLEEAVNRDTARIGRGERGVGREVIVRFFEQNNIEPLTGKWA